MRSADVSRFDNPDVHSSSTQFRMARLDEIPVTSDLPRSRMREIFRYPKGDNLPFKAASQEDGLCRFIDFPSLRYLEDAMAVALGAPAVVGEPIVWLARADRLGR